MAEQQLLPLTQPDRLRAAGLPWATTDAARWGYRRRHDHGTAAAFVHIGRRIYVDPSKFHELIRRQAG